MLEVSPGRPGLAQCMRGGMAEVHRHLEFGHPLDIGGSSPSYI